MICPLAAAVRDYLACDRGVTTVDLRRELNEHACDSCVDHTPGPRLHSVNDRADRQEKR